MKVLVVSGVSHATGAFSRQCELVRGLIAAGVEVVWLGPIVRAPIAGVQYVALGGLGQTLRITQLRRRVSNWLRKNASQVDGYVAFGEYDVAIFASWARRSNRSIVLFSRADIIANEFLRLASRRGFGMVVGWLKLASYISMRRTVIRRCAAIVVQTPQLEWQMRFIDPKLRQRIMVLPNNSNPSWTRQDLRASWQTAPRGPEQIVGYIGRVSPDRGLEELIRAVASMEPAVRPRLAIFGGQVNAGLSGLMDSLGAGIDRSIFKGESDKAQAEMAKMDVLVANRFVEACPNIALEAMAVGVPMVANDLPPYRFLLGRGGVFCQPGYSESLTKALQSLLTDRDRSEAYSRYLLERSRMFEFDWAAAAAGIVTAVVGRHAVVMPDEVRRLLGGPDIF